jgi:hypothetical protein
VNSQLVLILVVNKNGESESERFCQYLRLRNQSYLVVKGSDEIVKADFRGVALVSIFGADRSLLENLKDRVLTHLRNGGTVYLKGTSASSVSQLCPHVHTQRAVFTQTYCYATAPELHPILSQAGLFHTAGQTALRLAWDGNEHALRPLGMMLSADERHTFFAVVDYPQGGRLFLDTSCLMRSRQLEESIISTLGNADTLFCEYSYLTLLRTLNPAVSTLSQTPCFDLIIDDRPINDWFLHGKIDRFLSHLRAIHPDVHVDLAWVPNQASILDSLMRMYRSHDVGFLRHGFDSHFRHDIVTNYTERFQRGTSLIKAAEQRYQIRFQNAFVFPYSRACKEAIDLLARAGYSCVVHGPDQPLGQEVTDQIMFGARGMEDLYGSMPILARYKPSRVTEAFVLAHLILGQPLVVYGHPSDIGISRRQFLERRDARMGFFDQVLHLARKWGMIGRSIEEIVSSYGSLLAM